VVICRLAGTVASAVLILPPAAVLVAPPAAAALGAAAVSVARAAAVRPVARATPTPFVACPAPGTSRFVPPSAPPTPPVDPDDRAVGGEALATKGLAVPSGARTPPSVTATSWLVADLNSGAVLGACGPHEYRTPASVQKLLLAATMMPRLDPGRIVEVTESDMDFEPGSSAVGLVEHGKYPVRALWLGLLLNSGNDAANVLARVGGGAEGRPGGIEAMNAEAHRLGAYQTHAVTPSGLDGPGQFTSAYDLALIARACYAREDFRRYTATRLAQIPAQPGKPGFQIANDNGLLDRYPGMLGGKTGFTDLARQTYVGVAERGGRRLVVTLLGSEPQPLGSLTEATGLLDWGFALPPDAAIGHLVAPAEPALTATSTPTSLPASLVPSAAAVFRSTGGTDRTPSVALVAVAVAALVVALILLLPVTRRRLAGYVGPARRRRRPPHG
jgi:D-alanyl-D-alanine carboxypeptidase (penicillin-binding protein 5/6)